MPMSATLVGALTLFAATLATVPAFAEARFEVRDGVLYVTNVERPAPPSSAARPAPALPRVVNVARPAAYRDLIQQAAERYTLAPELVESVIRVESNFEPRAVSPKGASGLMQLMPATARMLGVHNVFDVAQNIDGGVRHLRSLLDRYRGDVALALAAYNAGAEAVARYRGIPPYAETQAYVARILQLLGRVGNVAASDGELHRYETADGAQVYSNVPLNRLSGAERAVLDRRP